MPPSSESWKNVGQDLNCVDDGTTVAGNLALNGDDQDVKADSVRWLQASLEDIDFSTYEDRQSCKDFLDFCPFKDSKRFLAYVLKILATQESKHIVRMLGLDGIIVSKHTTRSVRLYTEMIQHRGNVAGREVDRMKTNQAYLPRQFGFLDFMSRKVNLQSTFEDVAKACGKTIDEMKEFIDSFEGCISLVTEESAIEYLKHREHLKANSFEEHMSINNTSNLLGHGNLIDLNQLMVEVNSHQSGVQPTKQRKRAKQPKPYLKTSDLDGYTNSIAELQKWQLKMMNIECLMVALKGDTHFKNHLATKHPDIKGKEMMHTRQRSKHFVLQPNCSTVEEIMDNWMQMGVEKSSVLAHQGLINLAIFTTMTHGGMQRADSIYRCRYSDIEFRRLSQLASTQRTHMDIPLLISRMSESKTNQNQNIEYAIKIPNTQPMKCPYLFESLYLSYKHDCLKLKVNDFSHFIMDPDNVPHRPWYFDAIYSQLVQKKKSETYTFLGVKYPKVEMSLKKAYNLDLTGAQWRDTLASVDVNSLHTLHLGRVYGAQHNLMNGFEPVSRMGHWSTRGGGNSNDNVLMSYCTLQEVEALCKVAGSNSPCEYMPYWIMLSPPRTLQKLVLKNYHDEHDQIIKRIEIAKTVKDEVLQSMLWDEQGKNTTTYFKELAKLLLQGLLHLRSKYPRHDFMTKHEVVDSVFYGKWETTALIFYEMMTCLHSRMPLLFLNAQDIKFDFLVEEEDVIITPQIIDINRHSSIQTNDVISVMCKTMGCYINTEVALNNSISEDDLESLSSIPQKFISETIHNTIYEDLEREQSLLKGYLQRMTTLFFDKKTLDFPEAIQRKRHLPDLLESGNKEEAGESAVNPLLSSTPDVEVKSLPLLSTIDKRKDPILEVLKIWNIGSQEMRPLKQILIAPKPGFIRFHPRSKGPMTTAKRIRYICTAVELMEMEGIEDGAKRLNAYLTENSLGLRSLANLIQSALSKEDLSSKGKSLSAADIKCMKSYKRCNLFFMSL